MRSGFRRLILVAGLVWVAASSWSVYFPRQPRIPKDQWEAYAASEQKRLEERRRFFQELEDKAEYRPGFGLDDLRRIARGKKVRDVGFILVGPVGLWLLYAAGGWAVAGFQNTDDEKRARQRRFWRVALPVLLVYVSLPTLFALSWYWIALLFFDFELPPELAGAAAGGVLVCLTPAFLVLAWNSRYSKENRFTPRAVFWICLVSILIATWGML
jgi:hypothetical protein